VFEQGRRCQRPVDAKARTTVERQNRVAYRAGSTLDLYAIAGVACDCRVKDRRLTAARQLDPIATAPENLESFDLAGCLIEHPHAGAVYVVDGPAPETKCAVILSTNTLGATADIRVVERRLSRSVDAQAARSVPDQVDRSSLEN